MFTNIKCAITTAILSVLIFLLLLEILPKDENGVSLYSSPMTNDKQWFQSIEIVMLGSVFLAFNLNASLFSYCSTWKM